MNLIRADFYRIFKDKTLYILLAALIVFSLAVAYVYHSLDVESTSTVGDIVLKCIGADTLCTVLGLGIAMFLGRDYEQNTIRNKICCGEGRTKIFVTKLLESYVLAAIFFLVAAGAGALAGLLWFEKEIPEDFYNKLFCQLLIILAFASMLTALTVCTKSVKTPIIVTIVLFVILNPLALLLPGMGDSTLVRGLSRCVYMVSSGMLLSSVDGVYTAVKSTMIDGQWISVSYEYTGMYLNAILTAIIYTMASIAVTLVTMRRQEYK